MEPRWRNERNRLDPMKNAGYIGKLVERRVRSKDSAWLLLLVLLALISFVINLCVGRDIYATCTEQHERARAASRKKQAVIQDTTVFRPIAIPPTYRVSQN